MSKRCLVFCFTVMLLVGSTIYLSAGSAGSRSFAGSYSLRATGSEANYWNPANLYYYMPYNVEILLINSSFSLQNDLFSIRRYNDLNGKYLTDKDKRDIINDLSGSLSLKSAVHQSIVGISLHNMAFSSGVNIFAKGNLSSKYLELLLLGNEYDRVYHFGRKNNNFRALGYIDFTGGISPYSFYLGEYLIHTGISFSLLGGLGVLKTEEYKGTLSANDEGVHLEQEIIVKSGIAGYGMKSLLGFRCDVDQNLSIGLTLDNVGGFIYWTNDTERRFYTAQIDSVYIYKLDEDVFDHSETTEEIGNFTTTLPIYTRFSVLYRLPMIDFSLDWKQGFTNSVVTSKTPEISMGTEYYAIPQLALRMGFRPGLGKEVYSLSYGIGYVERSYEINFGIESVGALVPSIYSKGVAFAITSKLRF